MDLPPDIWFSEPGKREFFSRRLQVQNGADCASFSEWCGRSALSPLLAGEIVRLFGGESEPDAQRLATVSVDELLTYVRTSHTFYNCYYLQYFDHFAADLIPALGSGGEVSRLSCGLIRFSALLRRHMLEEEQGFLPYVGFLTLEAAHPRFSAAERFALLKRSPLGDAEHADEEEHCLLAHILRSVHRICRREPQFFFPWERLRRMVTDLRTDLNIHAFIEEKVLLPRALKLEEQVAERLRRDGERN